MKNIIKKKINDCILSFASLKSPSVQKNIYQSVKIILKSIKNKNKIIFCGNGGSAADSQHLAAELVGKYLKIRKALPALSITCDTSILTSIGNDMGFENIFSRQIDAIGNSGDVLFAMSTSGLSINILNAIAVAKKKKIRVIFLTSELLNKELKHCDVLFKVPAFRVDRIQEMHIAIGHIICELVEQNLN